MSRYIDRDKFIGNLATDHWGVTNMINVGIALDKSIADVVEVVRCKDCIFANTEDGKIKCYNTYGMLICTENEYCSRGRRSENGKS